MLGLWGSFRGVYGGGGLEMSEVVEDVGSAGASFGS